MSAPGLVADFTLTVEADGAVVVDPRFAGFAEVSGRTVTIKGYRVTLNTSALSHALLPFLSGWGQHLSPGTHEMTLVPARGYQFQPAPERSATRSLCRPLIQETRSISAIPTTWRSSRTSTGGPVVRDRRHEGENGYSRARPHPWAKCLPNGWEIERGTLETGDVVLSALPEGAVIERKTASDMASCIGANRERFERELKRGRYVGRLIV